MSNVGKATIPIIILVLTVGLAAGILVAPYASLVPPRTVTERVEHRETVTQALTSYRTETVTLTLTGRGSTVTVQPSLPLKLEVRYSRQFEVIFTSGYKLVRDALNRTLILVPRGGEPPRGLEGTVVYTPIERVVLMSATHVALIERLRERAPWILDRVAGIMWGKQYEWYFGDVAERLSRGLIRDVGPDYSPSIEELVALRPDLVIIYTYPGMDLPQRLDELGIPYVVDNEYLETNPLGRFEWIKLVATFFNLDEEAYQIFSEVERGVRRVVEDASRSSGEAPLVCWFMVYRGTVYAAGGGSFPAETLDMLGARYAFSDIKSSGSVSINVEEAVTRCREADVVVYPTSFISNISEILAQAPELGVIKAFREGRVYAYAPTVYQLGYYDTEGWVRDLALILYPNLYPGAGLRYFVRLGE